MSTAIESQAEVIKIARSLGLAPEALGYLLEVDSEDLARLREQVSQAMFAGSAERFTLIAAASRVIPVSVAATIAQRALGPLLGAQMAGLLDPARAVRLAGRLQPEFLADVAMHLDPARAAAVISELPADLVGEVATVLAGRGDFVTMGRFVSYLEPGVISATFSRIPDAAMLQSAFVMEGKDRLDAIVALLPPDRIPRLMAAARADELWAEVLSLIGYLTPDTQSRLADMAAEDPATLAGLTDAAERLNAWDAVLPIVPRMNPANQARTASLTARVSDASLRRILATVNRRDLWGLFVPMVATSMDQAGRSRVASVLATEPAAVIDALADAVVAQNLWADLLRIAADMREAELQAIADRLLGTALEPRLRAMLDAAAANDLWGEGLALLARLSPELRRRLVPIVAAVDPDTARTVLARADSLGLGAGLGPIGESLRQAAARQAAGPPPFTSSL
jgi:hypothetical protein